MRLTAKAEDLEIVCEVVAVESRYSSVADCARLRCCFVARAELFTLGSARMESQKLRLYSHGILDHRDSPRNWIGVVVLIGPEIEIRAREHGQQQAHESDQRKDGIDPFQSGASALSC
jgi:hypothetical protein